MAIAERLFDQVHPLLVSLLESGASEAEFWARIELERTPLVEPNPAMPGYSIVTYVFPAPPEAEYVVVQPGFGEARDHVMARIQGTNVCWASYSYRNDVRTSYSFVPDLPLVSWEEADEAEIGELLAFLREFPPASDPHHREFFASRAGDGLPDRVHSFVSLEGAPDESYVRKRTGVSRGWIDHHVFRSERMANERNIWVYAPPGYQTGDEAYPVLLAFDGGQALSLIPTQRILDNLLADGRIRLVVAVFVDNPTPLSRNEELPCNESFAEFIDQELMPWLRGVYRVSHDPRDHFVTGASYGGLAAMWLGFQLPHVFGNVIAQAPSLWWGPGYKMNVPHGPAPEWLIEQYEQSPRLPVRIWMEAGLMDHPRLMLEACRRMKASLESKGYDLTYSEPSGGHDTALFRGTLVNALATMLKPT